MVPLIEVLRSIIGISGQEANSSYGFLMEYTIAGMLIVIVVGSIFKILVNWSKR